MATATALVLDLANIAGGLILAAALLRELPRVGPALARLTDLLTRAGVLVGVLALAAGGYYLVVHLASGPHVFHFELIGVAVGVALLRERLFPATAAATGTASTTGTASGLPAGPRPGPQGWIDTRQAPAPPAGTQAPPVSGAMLLLAVFGLVAIAVGVQGLLTPDG